MPEMPDKNRSVPMPPDPAADDGRDDLYDPSTVEVNRARQRGDGVGQTDLDRQRDPTGAESADRLGRNS